MRSRLAVLALVLAVAACTEAKPGKQAAGNPGATADAVHAPRKPGAPAGAPPSNASPARKGGPGALPPPPARDQPVEVVNSMKMSMAVNAVMGSQTQPLGTLEPKQQKKYNLHIPAGAYLLIKASDSTGKHQVQATLIGVGPVLNFVIR